MNPEDYLTPGVSPDIINTANASSGDPAQQAFTAEYNAFGVKVDTAPTLSITAPANNVGVVNPVGTTAPQSTAGAVQDASTIRNSPSVSYDNGIGYWIGIDSDGNPKVFFGNSAGIRFLFDGTTIDFNAPANVSSINIPDTTTANSFHVDSSGNSWWGANVGTGYTGANAYILSNGFASFKNVTIGGTTVQYTITNSGIFSYGDGSDGTATCDGSTSVAGMSLAGSTYTMTRDVYFTNLTVNSGITVNCAGYRIFVTQSFVINGHVHRDGNAGSVGGNGDTDGGGGPGAGGNGGSALSDGYLKGSIAGATGGNGGTSSGGPSHNGSNGNAVTNSLGFNGTNGGSGGSSAAGNNGSGGTGATATASNVKLTVGVQLAQLLDVSSSGSTVKYTSSASGGAGGGGAGGGGGASGGGGGGSGSGGGVLAIYAKSITIGASGSITSNGGNGGAGGTGHAGVGGGTQGAGGGGGGAGGNGGVIVLTYNTFTNNGSITVSGGTKGTGGSGGAGGSGGSAGGNGANGADGSAGTVYQFQLSL